MSALPRLATKTVLRLGGTVSATLPVSVFSKQIKKTNIAALANGYLPSSSGQSAVLYRLLVDTFELPGITFSARTKPGRWRGAEMVRLPAESHAAMSEWWKADRVAFRIENGEKWGALVKQANAYPHYAYYWHKTNEPDWSDKKQYENLSILCEKTVTEFESVALSYREQPSYLIQRDEAIKLILSDGILKMQCSC